MYSVCKKRKLEEEFYKLLKELQPKKEIIDLFEEIVLDVWKERKEESFKELKRLEKEIKVLKDKKERINELAIKRTFYDKTYKEEFQKVDMKLFLSI